MIHYISKIYQAQRILLQSSTFLLTVKHSYEGKFRITNHAWDDRLRDSSSDMFKELAASLEEGIQEMLVPESSLLNNDAEFYVTVLDFQPGSVVVHYR